MDRSDFPRLRAPRGLGKLVADTLMGFFAVGVFFGVLYLAAQNDERARIQDALDARSGAETKLQRAARAVCNDHPARANRQLEPRWTAAGELECITVVAQDGHQ